MDTAPTCVSWCLICLRYSVDRRKEVEHHARRPPVPTRLERRRHGGLHPSTALIRQGDAVPELISQRAGLVRVIWSCENLQQRVTLARLQRHLAKRTWRCNRAWQGVPQGEAGRDGTACHDDLADRYVVATRKRAPIDHVG